MVNVLPAAWIGSAVAFVAYPALRPYADETRMPGLAAMASDRWLAAHLLGMLGFVLVAFALRATLDRDRRAGGSARLVGPLAWWGAILVLPYYGGEAFGLHAIGRYATARQDPGLVEAVNGFRYQPLAITAFGVGLALLAAAGVLLIVGTRTSDRLTRAAALLTGVGLVLYLPQFFAAPGLRIGHGAVLGWGCLLFAVAVLRERRGLGRAADRDPRLARTGS
jgi:hypothetical protein